MDSVKLANVMAALNFNRGEYAVFGGACLAAHGIRLTTDLEIFVTNLLYGNLKKADWEERVTGSTGASYLTKHVDDVPVLLFTNCGSERWRPNVASYLQNPEMINDIAFMPLREMYAWKAATARPKDLADLTLIEAYWSAN